MWHVGEKVRTRGCCPTQSLHQGPLRLHLSLHLVCRLAPSRPPTPRPKICPGPAGLLASFGAHRWGIAQARIGQSQTLIDHTCAVDRTSELQFPSEDTTTPRPFPGFIALSPLGCDDATPLPPTRLPARHHAPSSPPNRSPPMHLTFYPPALGFNTDSLEAATRTNNAARWLRAAGRMSRNLTCCFRREGEWAEARARCDTCIEARSEHHLHQIWMR